MDTAIHLLNNWDKLIFIYSFPVTLPFSFPFSILVLVPIPVSIRNFGFLLFQTPLVEILSLLDCFV